MRVLLLNNFAHITGGADRNVLGLTAALRERGHEVSLLATASDLNVEREGRFVRAPVTHASRDRLGVVAKSDVAARALWNPEAAEAMRHLIARFRPDVVHAHKLYPQLSVAPVILAARAGLRIVQTLHDYEFLSASHVRHGGSWLDRDEARASYRVLNTATFPVRRRIHLPRVTAAIACSRFVATQYRDKGTRSTVIPLSVEPAQDPPKGFSDRSGAVFIGRLQEEKGVLDVLRLGQLLPSVDVRVVGYGPLENAVAEAARRHANISFLGRLGRGGVMRELGRARICVMPSRWQEPAGIAALEAMSVGTPVVAYRSGGLAEYVRDAGGGEVITASAIALARACETLHHDGRRWQEYSDAGIGSVRRAHSPEQYASRVEALYLRVLNTSPD